MGDRARATIKVKVEIVNVDSRLFPEMSATVYFLPTESSQTTDPQAPDQNARRVWCDREAVRTDESGSFVWVLDERQRVRRHPVTTGTERDSRIEIANGLSGSEEVVIAPEDIQPGQLVNVAP
jgi:multidrug efflux pump subunit AcrA (membrane-fusion protein)